MFVVYDEMAISGGKVEKCARTLNKVAGMLSIRPSSFLKLPISDAV